jgi:hypothetical protein
VGEQGTVSSNAGQRVAFERCFMDERGWPYLMTSGGFGLVHTQDVGTLAAAVDQYGWEVEDVLLADLPQRFAYCSSPQRWSTSPSQQ